MFSDCASLESVTLPTSLTNIPNNMFYGCSKLASIVIPSAVASIGSQAFYSCSHLSQIICENTTPPTLGTNALQYVPSTCPIYVPDESVDTYKSTSGWSARASYINGISEIPS